jgi:hypothetical protein
MKYPEADMSGMEAALDPAELTKRSLAPLITAAIGAVAGGGVYAASSVATRKMWPQTESEIVPFDDADEGYAPERWLLMPGHGQHQPQQMMQELMSGALAGQKLSAFQYAGKFDIGEMADKLHAFGQTTDTLHVFGNSLGTLTLLEAWRAMTREQKKVFPRLGTLALSGCPLDVTDTFDGKLATIISRFPYGGGVVGKFLLGSVERIRENHASFAEIRAQVREARKALRDGQSSPTWIGQTKFLARTKRDNVLQHAEDFRGLIIPETRAVFLMPDKEGADTTVRDRRAFGRWTPFFARFGVELDKLLLPNAVHADIPRASEHLGAWIAKAPEPGDPEALLQVAG